ncbi:MAG: aquaporin [Acidimicrobiales bacterium]
MRDSKIIAAEAVGTFILMIGGPGTAVLAAGTMGALGVAFAFGFALLIAAYAVGPISGCHINPAVTLGLVVMKKVEVAKAWSYIIGQLIGAAVGGGIIYLISELKDGNPIDNTGILATNGYTSDFKDGAVAFAGLGPAAIAEIVFTGLLVFVVLSTTSKKFATGQVGLTVGLTLTLIHLATIPIDNTSVNPARSFGVAIFEGGDALAQLWAFILFPLIGAVVGVLLWVLVDDEATMEGTMLADMQK